MDQHNESEMESLLPRHFDLLGDELLIMIFSRVPLEDHLSLARVCKRWQCITTEQLVYKDAQLVFKRHQNHEYLQRFVSVLNRIPRLQHLDISGVPYDVDCADYANNPLPKANILSAGAHLERNLKMVHFSVPLSVPNIPKILELNNETLVSLKIEDLFCQEIINNMDYDDMVLYREAHAELVEKILVAMKRLPALKTLTYDFDELWKYEADSNDEARIETVNQVMESIRSMRNLQKVTLLNLVWSPPRPHVRMEPMMLEELSLFETYGNDEALAALVLQSKKTLRKIQTPIDVGQSLLSALQLCPNLEFIHTTSIRPALAIAASASNLRTLIVTSYSEDPVQASEILESSLFMRLHKLYLDGEWEDSVLSAIVKQSINMKIVRLYWFYNGLLYYKNRKPPSKSLGSHGNPVVLLELLEGSMPNLQTLDIKLPKNWRDSDYKMVQDDWREPLKKLMNTRPSLNIV